MNKLSGEGGRNPLKSSSSTCLPAGTESQAPPSKTSFPSRVTKSRPVHRKKRIVKEERDPESSAETEQRFEGGNNTYGFGAEMM